MTKLRARASLRLLLLAMFLSRVNFQLAPHRPRNGTASLLGLHVLTWRFRLALLCERQVVHRMLALAKRIAPEPAA